MPARFCRICGSPAAEGSMFCGAHRAQAALFSHTLASDAPPPEPAPSQPLAEGDLAALEAALGASLERIAANPKAQARRRYPLIVLYYLQGELHCRPYYAVAPRTNDSGFAPAADFVKKALSVGGVVYAELSRRFAERRVDLQSGALLSLELELCTFSDEINLYARQSERVRTVLARFRRDGERIELAAKLEVGANSVMVSP